jgi:hypothetical protein
MAKGLPQIVKDNVDKCRAAAIAAVDVYNRPGPRFRTVHYIVLIVMAWTACFHAIYYRKHVKPWHKKPGKNAKGDRYVHVDGEPKHWELSECLKQHFAGASPPVRKNLEFLLGLRNKIEHRNLPDLDAGLYGECQAALLNLEEMLVAEFGNRYALAEQLAVSLQFSNLMPPAKKKAAKGMAASATRSVKEYVEKFRGGLPSSTLNSTKYSFNVFLVPKVANKVEFADASVEFIRIDQANDEELSRLEKLNVLIKEKHIPIANLDLLKPTEVVEKVAPKLPHRFTLSSHAKAWRHFKVRPVTGSTKPEITDAKYCVRDAAHNDYLYTDAWVDKLSKELVDPKVFEQVVGSAPMPK